MCTKCQMAGIGKLKNKTNHKMSKRRKNKKIGFLKGVDFQGALMLAGGAVAGNFVAQKVVPMVPEMIPAKATGAGLILIGAILPEVAKVKGMESLITGIGAGMAVAGGQILLQEFGIAGIDQASPSIGLAYGPYNPTAQREIQKQMGWG